MDSLMAIEMHMSINNRLGINLPVMGLAEIPTVTELVDKIFKQGLSDAPEVEARSDVTVVENPGGVSAGTGD
jgi:hypothetical protein